MTERIEHVTTDLKKMSDDARAAFRQLSVEQLNWKPGPKKWSVAQCLDHLIVIHSLYFPLFERLAAGSVKQTFWERSSPFSRFFGRFLIKSMDPANVKPMKTAAKAYPASSDIDAGILDRFVDHQQQLIEHLERLPNTLDAEKTILTSPLMAFVTYSLDDTFTILTHHCRRHFDQAKRVMETEGFPK